MAIGDSIIRVTIIGDAKKLEAAIGRADKAAGKLGPSLGGAIKGIGVGLVGLAAVDKAFDFVQGGLDLAGQFADAQGRLNRLVGEFDGKKLSDMADDFTDIGLSSTEFETLAADFAGLATSAGIAAPDIASVAGDAVKIAGALALERNQDPGEFIAAIGKAAGGAKKPLQLLNISVDEAAVAQLALHESGKDNPKLLTDQELATARLHIILQKLNPVLADAATGSKDVGDMQDIMSAKADTLAQKLGTQLTPALVDVLKFITDEIDAIPGAIAGWEKLGSVVVGFARDVLGPLGNVRDVIGDILGGLGDVAANANRGIAAITGGKVSTSEAQVNQAVRNFNLRNGQGGI